MSSQPREPRGIVEEKLNNTTNQNCRLEPLGSTFGHFYVLTSFFGHKNCLHRKKFQFGLSLWIINLTIHFCLDFYEAYYIFGAAWATAIGMFLITFITASICLAKVTLLWLENSLLLLHQDGNYPETLRIMKIVLRVVPVVVICLGLTGGAGQYTCYYMDGATRLDFDVLPKWLQMLLNVLRFTSLLYVFCGYSLFLAVPVCVMIVTQLSMKEFKVSIDKQFHKTPSSLRFGRAVKLFEQRASFVRKSSSSCSMILAILVMSSTLSFVINAYNFLFVRRLAIYFWFAVLPLLWIAIPLALAAWVTETYQTFAGIVLKNWAQASQDGATIPGADIPGEKSMSCDVCRLHRASACSDSTGRQYARRKFSKRLGMGTVIRPFQMNRPPTSGPTTLEVGTLQDYEEQNVHQNPLYQQRPFISSGRNAYPNMNGTTPIQGPAGRVLRGPGYEVDQNAQVILPPLSVSGRFDFERYMIYLQCLLPDVGFSVCGCLISWDKVFALGLFMTSLSAVFTQEVLFGSRKNTLGRL